MKSTNGTPIGTFAAVCLVIYTTMFGYRLFSTRFTLSYTISGEIVRRQAKSPRKQGLFPNMLHGLQAKSICTAFCGFCPQPIKPA